MSATPTEPTEPTDPKEPTMNESDTTAAYERADLSSPQTRAEETPTDSVPSGGAHPVNIAHLVMGLVFLGCVAVWGLAAADVVSNVDLRWLLPLPWLFAGGAGLVALVAAGRRRTA